MRQLAPSLRRLTLVALLLTGVAALLRFVPGPEPWPDWYRRLVRRTHPILYRLGLVGGRHSSLASVEYVGRKSGTLRQTPVWAFVTDDHVLVGLPYGRGVDWVRNVLASGHCRMRIHGQAYELDEPQVRASAELPELPGWRRRMFSDSMEYLRLRVFRVYPGTLDSTGPENWYLKNRSRIMWETRLTLRHARKHLAAAYGKAEGEAILKESLQRFEALLPDIPYIGGAENPNTQSLCMAAAWLAMYRSLQARGASVEEAARILYLGTASFIGSIPMRWLMRWQGRRLFDPRRIEKRQRAAEASQQRRYPDDWVFEIVDSDGQEFDFGVDYTECGIVKYFAREGAPELVPYGCWIDYPMCAAMGVRLDRTETIAQGGQRCDFRMSRREPVEVEPDFVHV